MSEKPIEIVVAPMAVAELAEKLKIPVNTLILTLLRKGISAARNQVLSEKVVAQVAAMHEAQVIQPWPKKRLFMI